MPLGVGLDDRQVDQLGRGLLVGEVPAGLDRLADLAVQALNELAEVLRAHRRLETQALLRAVARIQARIVSQGRLQREAAWEIAEDICVYAAADWDGRLVQTQPPEPYPCP